MRKIPKYSTIWSVHYDTECLCDEDTFDKDIEGKSSFVGKPLSEVSSCIHFQENITSAKIANDNYDRLDETEEEKEEREQRETEARLSIEEFNQEHEARVQSLIDKHKPKRGRPRKEKPWNGEYRIDYPAARNYYPE